jgi:hypothetical protein
LQNSGVDFYWVDGADRREVIYSITVSGRVYSAKATFDVKKPNVEINKSQSPVIGIILSFNEPYFKYGDSLISPGVRFVANTNNSGVTGEYKWVQTYAENKTIRLTNPLFGCRVGRIAERKGTGLDEPYPYRAGNLLEDTPQIGLNTSFDKLTVNDSSVSYFMFKPNTANSIWVPIKAITWAWGGTVNRPNLSNNDWFIESGSIIKPPPVELSTYDFPQWQKVVQNNSWKCQE